MRKFTISTIAFGIMILLVFQSTEVKTNQVQPNAQRTGAPSELTCGTSDCHNTTPNTFPGNVTISFNGGINTYVPGNTYQVTITVTETGITKFGFECTSLDASNDSVGTWLGAVSGSIAFPTLPNTLHRKYVSHHNANSNNTWIVNWKAPAIDKGPLTFYAAGNAANGNMLSTGDHIYTSSLTILPDATGINEVSDNHSSFIIQNPVHDRLTLQYHLETSDRVLINVYNLNGQLVKTAYDANETSGVHIHTFDMTDMEEGLYFVHFISGAISHTEKIIVE